MSTLDWLYQKLQHQVTSAQACLEAYVDAIEAKHPTKANQSRTELNYWLDRIKNTQRVIEEYEDEVLAKGE